MAQRDSIETADAETNEIVDLSLATFGGGCFWCVEAAFEEMPGVRAVTSGYAGGHVDDPSYEQVCGGGSGHAEVVQIEYDPARVTYTTLLERFFAVHDPTQLNRQGADVGSQYRSVIFFHDETQRQAAELVLRQLAQQQVFPGPVVTQVAPAGRFYAAEHYHQSYYTRNPRAPYCQLVIRPKLDKLQQPTASDGPQPAAIASS